MERLDLKLRWLNDADLPQPLGARSATAPMYRLVERLGSYFVPIVISIAIVTGSIWWLLTGSLSTAIDAGVGVLIIACPYALGLAIPMATIVATRKGARQGILIENHRSLQLLQRVKTIVFDRASLLVPGKQTVTDFIPVVDNYHGNDLDILQLTASIEAGVRHPLAAAIVDRARAQRLELKSVEKFRSVDGCGVQGIVDGKLIQVGSSTWFATLQIATVLQATNCQILATYQQQWEAVGKTVVWMAIDREIAGIFGIGDAIKPTAAIAISNLKNLGLETVLLTETNLACAQSLAGDLRIDKVFAPVKPPEKIEIIRSLQSKLVDKHRSLVAMVGAENDNAQMLTQADIRIGLGKSIDRTMTSDLRIISSDLRAIIAAIDLHRSTLTRIERKLLLAFIYTPLFILFVAGILYILIGKSLIAAISIFTMAVSSIFVLISSLRSTRIQPKTGAPLHD
jgi:P-type Cu+ transporter